MMVPLTVIKKTYFNVQFRNNFCTEKKSALAQKFKIYSRAANDIACYD